jgi:signal transduction histidine kinase
VRSLVTTRQAEREFVDAEAMIREVLAVLKGEAERRGVVVETSIAPRLPPLHVDRVQAQQGLVNLCINAMEAMAECPAGQRVLGVRASNGADGSVVISVSDTGPGISPEHLPGLFDAFFTTKSQGTGLGLSITRTIAEAHGGNLAAENRQSGGAVFRLTLPARAAVTP